MLASLSHTGLKYREENRTQGLECDLAQSHSRQSQLLLTGREGAGEHRAVHADVQFLRSQCWPLFLGDGWEDGRAWRSLQTQAPRSVPHFLSPLTLLSLRRVMDKMGVDDSHSLHVRGNLSGRWK